MLSFFKWGELPPTQRALFSRTRADPTEARNASPQNMQERCNFLRRIALQKLKGHKHAPNSHFTVCISRSVPGESPGFGPKNEEKMSNLLKFGQIWSNSSNLGSIRRPSSLGFVQHFRHLSHHS